MLLMIIINNHHQAKELFTMPRGGESAAELELHDAHSFDLTARPECRVFLPNAANRGMLEEFN